MQPVNNKKSRKGKGSDWREPPKPNISKPSGTWRKKYECKVNKGKHTFEIILPNHPLPEEYSTMSPGLYYSIKREEYNICKETCKELEGNHYCCPVYVYYKCKSCGKIKTVCQKESN